MWRYRTMLEICWTERLSNKQVSNRAGAKMEMMRVNRRRQLRFRGHVMRRQQMESDCMTGRWDGRRERGRPRIKLMDSLAKAGGRGTRPVELLQMTKTGNPWWPTSLGICTAIRVFYFLSQNRKFLSNQLYFP